MILAAAPIRRWELSAAWLDRVAVFDDEARCVPIQLDRNPDSTNSMPLLAGASP